MLYTKDCYDVDFKYLLSKGFTEEESKHFIMSLIEKVRKINDSEYCYLLAHI